MTVSIRSGATDGALQLNGQDVVAFDTNGIKSNIQSINGGQISGFRNKIINGDKQISQVLGSTAITAGAGLPYVIDQWQVESSQASKLTFQQVTDAPPGFKYSTKITVAAQYAPLATDFFSYRQPIEGQDLVDLMFGTATPATIAVSLMVKGSVPGTYPITINNGGVGGATKSYIGLVTVTTAWALVVTLTAMQELGQQLMRNVRSVQLLL